jgi:hypothetical protein
MDLDKAIVKTIDYVKKFGDEINEIDIEQRLISKNIYKRKEIVAALKSFGFKNKGSKWQKNKLIRVMELKNLIRVNFKDILFLGVSGSVAARHPKKNDDIDIVIVTKKNKLWLNRLKLRLFVFLRKIPHRKYGRKGQRDEFCFNLWLDECSLQLPKKKQNLHSAMDLIMMLPIFDQKETYQKFLRENAWAENYVATGYSKLINKPAIQQDKLLRINSKSKEKNNRFDNTVNKLFFLGQYWYMRRKITTEEVNCHQAFFYK